jgi:vacuolar-type H+-ATPase subunit H
VTAVAPGPARTAAGQDLADLLALEHRLEAELHAARDAADAVGAAARQRAASLEAGMTAEVERAEHALEARVTAERDAKATAILGEAKARAATFDAVGDAALQRLAQAVLASLVEGDAP